ncbi:MAG: AsmA family protein [Thermodesulfobacteriota bacterium]
MAKTVKILGMVLGALVVLVVLAALILPRVVNPNAYKTKIAELVRERTGRTLTFGGDLSLSVFPWLGVRTGALALSNAPGFGDAPFAAVQEADVRVRLLPLLSREVEVDTVVVRGLALNLARDSRGKGNWEDLAGTKPPAASEVKEETLGEARPKTDKGPRIAALAVGGVRVEKAAITWEDRAAGQKAALKDLDLATGLVTPGRPVDIAFSTGLESTAPKLAGTVRLKARAEYAPEAQKSALSGLTLDVDLAGEDLPGGKLAASLAADLTMDYAKHRLDVANLKLAALGLNLSGKAAVDNLPAAPAAAVEINLAECNPRQVLAALGQAAPALADDKALTRLAATLTLKASAQRVDAPSLKLSLDDTALTGKAAAWDFSRPAVSFDLSADALDLGRYLPAEGKTPAKGEEKEAKKPAPGEKGGKTEPEAGLPKDRLRALLLDGSLQVGALKVYGARLTDMTVKVTAKDGVVRMSPFTASLYGGRVRSDLTADMSRNLTRSTLGLDLQDVLLGDLLQEVLGDDKATGAAQLKLDLSADGEDPKSLVRSLDGLASFALRNGVIKGFQVIPKAVLEQASANDPKKRVETAEKQQAFKDITATFKIKDGVARTSDLTFLADHLKVTGSGLADLGKEAVNCKIKADLTGAPVIPFTVTGPFDNVSASLDTAEFVKGLALGVVKLPAEVGKGALDVGKGALEGIGKGLGSIFGGDKKDEKKQ